MTQSQKTIKRVCKCENCGNEAEMVITCTLPEAGTDSPTTAPKAKTPVQGHATCSHCGGEADMWIDDL